MDRNNFWPTLGRWIGKLALTLSILFISYVAGIFLFLLMPSGLHIILVILPFAFLPALIPPIFMKKHRGAYFRGYVIVFFLYVAALAVNLVYIDYDNHRKVELTPDIDIYDYYPWNPDNLLAKLPQKSSLQFTDQDALPRIDGATAVFPIYSAFVREVYPEGILLHNQSVFDHDRNLIQDYCWEPTAYQFNNTRGGYNSLADRETDIFFGAYPSQEQLDYAAQQGTKFVFTPIGYEAFVFFVHKDNPIDSLTVEEIQDIYSGKITNWAQLGGNWEPIRAYQRNEGSGSQSQLIRFMEGKELMDPPSEWRSGSMGGIVETVADYRLSTASIGFSFRYYVETLIANPDIKILAIDGIAPTLETIGNGSYPIVGPLYAVTWEGNDNENVQKLLDWILSPEGQYIIQETGYTPITPVT